MTSSSIESVGSLPFWWRVTRYDPNRRNDAGAYRDETWTSIADVGGMFEGSELTIEDYERVEDAYVDAFLAFATESDVDRLQVRSVEQAVSLEEGEVVSVDKAADIVRLMLREEVICKLETPTDDFALHVGFDLYMYVGSARPRVRAIELAGELGPYVDDNWPSPQLPEDE